MIYSRHYRALFTETRRFTQSSLFSRLPISWKCIFSFQCHDWPQICQLLRTCKWNLTFHFCQIYYEKQIDQQMLTHDGFKLNEHIGKPCEHFEFGALQKCENFVEFEKWCNMSVDSQTISFDTAAEDEPSKVCYEGLTNTTTRLGVLLHSAVGPSVLYCVVHRTYSPLILSARAQGENCRNFRSN